MIFQISGMFVNTLTADEKYSLLNCANLMEAVQMSYVRKKKIFLICFLHV